jgi:tRNA nucleotidyltransferase (CCA-adding enzyme)
MFDFFGGQRDLKDKAIRVLHNLSFIEDPTRLFRAVRFEQRLGFKIGAQTERLMKSAVRMNLVKRLGGARILNELQLILSEAHILPALERLYQFDLLKYVDKKIKFDQACRQLLIAAGRASNWFDLLYTGETYQRWQLYMLCLFNRQSAASVKRTVQWLGIMGHDYVLFVEQRERALALLKRFSCSKKGEGEPSNSTLFRWFSGLRLEILMFVMAAAPH